MNNENKREDDIKATATATAYSDWPGSAPKSETCGQFGIMHYFQ